VRLDVLLQLTCARLAQEPDNNCKRALVKLAPMELKVIVGLVVCAVNEYHTSYNGVPQPVGAGIEADKVAPLTLPVLLVQVTPDVRVTAPAQLSLAGAGSVMQILKVPLDDGAALVENTLT
jgi:hypothetical protein